MKQTIYQSRSKNAARTLSYHKKSLISVANEKQFLTDFTKLHTKSDKITHSEDFFNHEAWEFHQTFLYR